MRRPVCALFAGALGAQLIAAFEPQAGFWPLAALFGFAGLVLAAGGRARGYGLWLLLGAALGLGFSVRTGAQFSALTERYDGRTVRLTATEYKILLLLMENLGQVFSAEQIYEKVWEESANFAVENTVMVHIRHIREKIEIDTKKPRYVKVVWGIGYKMEKYR